MSLLSEKTRVWRHGVMKNLSASLRNKNLASLLEECIYASRAMTAGTFHTVWSTVLDFLVHAGEQSCVDCILAHYIYKYHGMLSAVWRTGVDRCIPGLCPASQSQEKWHCSRLRVGLGPRKETLDTAFTNLEAFFASRAAELEKGPPVFFRTPANCWDKSLIRGLLAFGFVLLCVLSVLDLVMCIEISLC